MGFFTFVALFLFFATGCTHGVYRLDVERNVSEAIDRSVAHSCSDSSCEMTGCWRETEDIFVCNVDFTMRLDGFKRKTLEAAALSLKNDGLKVGFCGHDSFATQMFAAFLGGLAGGALGHGLGGSSYSGAVIAGSVAASDISEKVYTDEKLIVRACGSTPAEEN